MLLVILAVTTCDSLVAVESKSIQSNNNQSCIGENLVTKN